MFFARTIEQVDRKQEKDNAREPSDSLHYVTSRNGQPWILEKFGVEFCIDTHI